MWEQVYPDTFYIEIYEELIQRDGSASNYNYFMDNPTTIELMEGYRSTTKSELKQKIDEFLSRKTDIEDFTVSEDEFGFIYERYVNQSKDETVYELGNENNFTDHEKFTVHVKYYEDVYGIFSKLND